MHFDYDLAVIGSGSAGLSAVEYAVSKQKKVVIVENEAWGGECPNFACVPAKIFLKSAEIYRQAQHAATFGIDQRGLSFDWDRIRARRDQITSALGGKRIKDILKTWNVELISGSAHFADAHSLVIGKRHMTAERFIVATGSRPFIPPIDGLKQTGFLTSKDLNFLEKLPKKLAIIGSGPVGLEYATMFASLGVEVSLFERASYLAPNFDQEISAIIAENLTGVGVTIYLDAEIHTVSPDKTLHFIEQKKRHALSVDEVLVAVGTIANTEHLQAEKAGVQVDPKSKKIITTAYLQSSAAHIWAAGDVASAFKYTHIATYEGRLASHNALQKDSANWWAIQEEVVPAVTFCSPEVATVGITQEKADQEYKGKYVVGRYGLSALGKGLVDGVNGGLIKMIVHRDTGMVLGAHIAGPSAGELIHELALAMRHQLSAEDIAATIHAYPSYAEGIKAAAIDAISKL